MRWIFGVPCPDPVEIAGERFAVTVVPKLGERIERKPVKKPSLRRDNPRPSCGGRMLGEAA